MRSLGRSLVLAGALLLAGCGDDGESVAEPAPSAGPTLTAGRAKLPPQVADFPVLASEDCTQVVQFYLEAIGGGEYAQAALVWDDPVIDAARLEAVFAPYEEPQVEWTEPVVEGAAGSLHCTVSGTLTDARDPARPAREGTLQLRRANDVPGATADQRRWTLQSSSFVEQLERSGTGEP